MASGKFILGRKGRSAFFLKAACLMVLLLPVVRLLEALVRSIFMSEYYESFWEGLTRDLWFSEGWIAYIKTPLGLTMSLLPVVLLAGAVSSFFLSVRSGS